MIYLHICRRWNILSWVMRLFTMSHWSHAELQVGNKFLSVNGKKGVFIRTKEEFEITQDVIETWEIILPNYFNENRILKFFEDRIGVGYDYFSVLSLGLWRRDWKDQEHKWFCSEIVAAALASENAYLCNKNITPNRLTPGDLRMSNLLINKTYRSNVHDKGWIKRILSAFKLV